MPNIKIIVDSAADMPVDLQEKYDIGIFHILSIFGEKSYRPGVDLTNGDFYKMLRETGVFPTTAQSSYVEMQESITEFLKEYDDILIFTVSSKASGQFSTLNMLRNDMEEADRNRIHIIDTMTFTVAISMQAIYAAELAKTEDDINVIKEKSVEYMSKWDEYFLVDTLTYLEKGGRINKSSAIIGALLDVKPVLSIKNGLIEAVDKFRGKKKIVNKLIQKIKENPNFDTEDLRFSVVHADNDDLGQEMVNSLKNEFENAEIVMYNEVGPIIGTHSGPNLIGVFFRTK